MLLIEVGGDEEGKVGRPSTKRGTTHFFLQFTVGGRQVRVE